MADFGADPYEDLLRPRDPLPLVWLKDIEPALDAQDFVEGVLLEQSAAVVYGESNSGKTFWTVDLALHVAAGRRWCGRRVEQGGVLYCILEGGHAFRNRVVAWRRAHLELGEDIPFAAIPAPLNLLDMEVDVSRLVDAIRTAAASIGVPVRLVVIDTLSRALAGGDENSSMDMGSLVAAMDAIRQTTGACALFVHHSGKDAARGARGHSLLRAAIDTEVEISVGEGGERTATIHKQRDLAKGQSFTFSLSPVALGENQYGEPVTSCIVVPGDDGNPVDRTPALTPDEKGWLKDLASFFDDPGRGMEGVRPTLESGVVRGATRAEIRAWLIDRGRLGVAGHVAGGDGLTATERSQLSRYLNRLKDKGKLGVFKDWIWLP